jgi:hypothetical protein
MSWSTWRRKDCHGLEPWHERRPRRSIQLEHDPDPKGHASAKCAAVSPRDERGTRLRGDHAYTTTWNAMTIHPDLIAL